LVKRWGEDVSETLPGQVAEFIRSMVPERTDLLKKIEKECHEEYIPLVQPETGQLLRVLAAVKDAERILEIGTGIGYSTILMAESGAARGAHVTTIEIDRKRYARARQNFLEAGLSSVITPLCGDANEIIPTLRGTFDLVFMDAAKGQYPEFFERVWSLLEPGGVLVVDNIFLNGWVIEMNWPKRRKKTMVCRVRELLESLKNHPLLDTALVPLGDGLTVSVRRRG